MMEAINSKHIKNIKIRQIGSAIRIESLYSTL